MWREVDMAVPEGKDAGVMRAGGVLRRGIIGAVLLTALGCGIVWLTYDRMVQSEVRDFQRFQLSAARQSAYVLTRQLDEIPDLLRFLGGQVEAGVSADELADVWQQRLMACSSGRRLVRGGWFSYGHSGEQVCLWSTEPGTPVPQTVLSELEQTWAKGCCHVSKPYFRGNEALVLFVMRYRDGSWAALDVPLNGLAELLGVHRALVAPSRFYVMDHYGYTLVHSVSEFVGRHYDENVDHKRFPQVHRFLAGSIKRREGAGRYVYLPIGQEGLSEPVVWYTAYRRLDVSGADNPWTLFITGPEYAFHGEAWGGRYIFAGLLLLQAFVLIVLFMLVYRSQIRMREQELRAHEAVLQSEAARRYRSIFESVGVPLILTDADGRILSANPQVCELLSVTRGDLEGGKSIRDVLPVHLVEELEAGGSRDPASGPATCVVTKKDGSRISLSVRRSETPEIGGRIYRLEDLTLRRQMEEQARLADRLDVFSEMSAVIAHEIRNPLSGLLLSANMLQQELPAGSPSQEDVHDMLAGAQQVEKVVRELLEFARPQEPGPSWVTPREIAEGALFFIEPYARKANVRVHTDVEEDLPHVFVDLQQMKQVLINVMINAVQAMPNGGRLDLRLYSQGKDVVTEVKDTGVGIAEEDRPRVFSPFFTTRARGTGLGLAISKNLCDENAAELRFESAVGEGTIFVVVFHSRVATESAVQASEDQTPR